MSDQWSNTLAVVIHRKLKLKNHHLYRLMKHPAHGREVKVFRAQVKDFHPMRHADSEVYFYKCQGHRARVDLALWLRNELKGLL